MDKQRIWDVLKQEKWKKIKKSDWAVLGLAGILLLVIAMPTDTKEERTLSDNQRLESSIEASAIGSDSQERDKSDTESAYVSRLEERLEDVLEQMEGVGKVKVMITVSDAGECVVEKDRVYENTITTETDSTGGNRNISETGDEEETIYVKTGDETYPYIQKQKMPTIEGVVVVAEGGDKSRVAANISESVKALLPVEAHRIKVVKMCSKEE